MEKTVAKALRLLETLAQSPQPAALGDLAERCDMTKSNAHRLLQTLGELDYVRQVPENRTYEATLRLWEMGMRVFDRIDIRTVAAPHLAALEETTGESVHLSIFDDGDAVYIDKVESRQAIRAYIRIGDRVPAYCTATGRAMLAFMDGHAVERACRDMERHTRLTITTPGGIDKALEAVRTSGYALTRGEWREGVVGVAAPIRSHGGIVIAGVGVAGPVDRMDDAAVVRATEAVPACAAAISRALGFSTERREARVA